MNVACPHCTQPLEIADEWAGQAVDCPSCQQALTVPAAPAMAVSQVAPNPQGARRSFSAKPPRRGGGGFGKFLLLVIILVGAGSGYLMVHFKESLPQVWNRQTDGVKKSAETPQPMATPTYPPASTSGPETASESMPPPSEASPRMPAPSVAEEPAASPVGPVAWLLEHKERAPKEVVLQRPATLALCENGRRIGSVTVAARTKVQVMGFTKETVSVRVGYAAGEIPVDATNLRVLAKAEQEKGTPSQAASAVQPEQAPQQVSPQQLAPLRVATTLPALRFAHPSIPLTVDDLAAIKANLDKQPWKRGYELLAANGHSQLTYEMQGPFETVTRNPDLNRWVWMSDMEAVYNLALMWYFTGDNAYAQKSHDILLAWATTQKSMGGQESGLMLGDYAYRYAGGADILRGTWPGWTAADTTTVSNYFLNVLWPGTSAWTNVPGPANKGSLNMQAGIAIAVFCHDTAKFNRVIDQYRAYPGSGLLNALPIGQMGETGRDSGHLYGGLLSMAFISEVAWKQGIDLYSELDNRLLAVAEYYARNTLALDNPFVPFGSVDALYWVNANGPYTANRAAFYLIQNAYKNRRGIPTPWIDRKLKEQHVDGNNFLYAKTADVTTATPLAESVRPAVSLASSGLTLTTLGDNSEGSSCSYANGVWTLSGLGNGVWQSAGGSDDCQFAYKQMRGDCAMVAKVTSFTNPGTQAGKCGLMLRDNLSATISKRGLVDVSWDSSGSTAIECRQDGWKENWAGSYFSVRSYTSPLGLPYWLKIERRGTLINTYSSLDGTSWSAMVSADYPNLPSTLYIGLFLCSGYTAPVTATFANVAFTGGSGGLVTTPDAPASVFADASDKAITVRWLPSFGATAYDLLRSTTSGSGYTAIASDLSTARTSYVDTAAAAGTIYYYVVRAKNSAGTSGNSPQFYGSLLPRAMVNLALSGTSTASFNEDSEMEGSAKAFDFDPGTKWFGYDSPEGWIQYDFGRDNAQVVKRYTINSADVADRDPKSWTFLGSQDGSNWTTLDSQSNQSFVTRMGMNTYEIGNTTAFRYYRLDITANNGATGVAVAELGLWGDGVHAIPFSKSLEHGKP